MFKFNFKKPSWYYAIVATFAFIGLSGIYGEYILSREVYYLIQMLCTAVYIIISAFYLKLMYNFVTVVIDSLESEDKSIK
jgi:hypothetical protein